MVLQNSENMEHIEVTDRAVFKDAPPELLRKLAVNRQSNNIFLAVHVIVSFSRVQIFVNTYEHLKLQYKLYRTKYEEGPWLVMTTPPTVQPLLTYCSDKTIRATIWDKWISRASKPNNLARVTSNARTIEALRRHQ